MKARQSCILNKGINNAMIARKKSLTIGIVVLSTGVIFASLYYLLLSSKIYPVIESRIYRSAQLSDKVLGEVIKEKGIRTIINLRGKDTDSSWYADENRMAGDMNVKLFDIRLISNELPRYRKLAAVLSILQDSEKPLLIHCKRGADRTGLVSALALVLEQDPPFSEVKNSSPRSMAFFPVMVQPALLSFHSTISGSVKPGTSTLRLFSWIGSDMSTWTGSEIWNSGSRRSTPPAGTISGGKNTPFRNI
jgi:protein tyrosine phosphatase (PTP) superfamily phosphohydrolase (DUF442 family)